MCYFVDCFIDKKTPSPTRNWLGVTNVIYLGVVSQQGIKPNNQLESDLKRKSMLGSHSWEPGNLIGKQEPGQILPEGTLGLPEGYLKGAGDYPGDSLGMLKRS